MWFWYVTVVLTCESSVCIQIEPRIKSDVTIQIESNLESNRPCILLNTRDLQIGRLRANRIWIESNEMCGTTDSSFQSSNTLNNTGVWSLIELASLYTVPVSTVNGLSRLTTMSNGQAWPIREFSNRPMTFESNRNGWFESNLEASQVPTLKCRYLLVFHLCGTLLLPVTQLHVKALKKCCSQWI